MARNPLFFDIEAGGLSGHRSSLLSISYGTNQNNIRTLVARPETGSMISRWSANKVWEPLKKRSNIQSEKQVLSQFLGVLQQHGPGGTVAGWNIGYDPTTQSIDPSKGPKGFDIPFLMTRAKAHGMEEEYKKAFSSVKIRDIGRESALQLASEVSKYPHLVDPEIFAQVKSFNKVATIKKNVEGLSGSALARAMSDYNLAGWKQETVAGLFGISYSSHQSESDAAALQKIVNSGKKFEGPEMVAAWNRETLKNRLVSAAFAGAKPGQTDNFWNSLEARAKKFNIFEDFEAVLRSEAKLRGADISKLKAGLGHKEIFTEFRPSNTVLETIGKNKVAAGLALGAALLLTKPLSLFSGKDDNYNTIEGLPHGGEAERSRRIHTAFGSGWQGEKAHDDVKERFSFFKRELTKYGSKTGTGHKRIWIPKKDLNEEDIKKLGFIPVNIAIPESGQASFVSYRNPNNTYHIHNQGDVWTMHRDAHPAATMLFRNAQNKSITDQIKAFASGMPHVFQEGIPGAYYYLKGLLTSNKTMKERLYKEVSPEYKKELLAFENRVSGKDDDYNTIEGLSHKGIAKDTRHEMTDFGSGWLRGAISKGMSHEGIIKGIMSRGSGLMESEAFESTARKLLTEGKVDELVQHVRSAQMVHGARAWSVEKRLGKGGMGEVFQVRDVQTGDVGIYKKTLGEQLDAAKMLEEGRFVRGPALSSLMNMDQSVRGLTAVEQHMENYMTEIANQSKEFGGMAGMEYERAMTIRAREQYGSIVPEVLDTTGENGGFVQEKLKAIPKEFHEKAVTWMKKQYKEMYAGSGMMHYDPHLGNMMMGSDGKFKIIDWGLSAQGTKLTKASRLESGIKSLSSYEEAYPEMERAKRLAKEMEEALEGGDTFAPDMKRFKGQVAVTPMSAKIDKQSWNQKHLDNMQRTAILGKNPGSQHTNKAGKIVK